MSNSDPSKKENFFPLIPPGLSEIFAGTFAGICGTVIGHPLDTIKVRLQTQSHYRGAFDCLIKIAKHEGVIKGLYKGLAPPLCSLTFLNSISFGAYFNMIKRFEEFDGQSRNYHFFLAGAITGSCAGFFSTPFDMIKTRSQLANMASKERISSWQCAKTLWKGHGWKAFYLGYATNTVRETIFCTIYFGTYEMTKKKINSHLVQDPSSSTNNSLAKLAIPFSGGLSGMFAWMISFPLDVVKANIQGGPLSKEAGRRSFFQIVQNRWQSGGLNAFYSGVGPSVMRAFLVSSTRFSSFELALHFLKSIGG